MKRFSQTCIVVCVAYLCSAGAGYSEPEPDFGIEADEFCADSGLAVKAEFQPQLAGNCFACHDDGNGGPGAGNTAFEEEDLQFFCAAPPVGGNPPPPAVAAGALVAVRVTREGLSGEAENGDGVELTGPVEEVSPSGLIIAGVIVDVSAFPDLTFTVGQEVQALGQYDPATGVLTADEIAADGGEEGMNQQEEEEPAQQGAG
ncbi:MAG: hypothetical protein ACR2RB_20020 [Gammaproteobacteria bacterium]